MSVTVKVYTLRAGQLHMHKSNARFASELVVVRDCVDD